MSNRRRHPRWTQRLTVRFWEADNTGVQGSGFTTDVSLGGTYIATGRPLTSGKRIRLEIEGPQGTFYVEGLVARSDKVPRELQRVKQAGMGIRFLRIDELVAEVAGRGAAAVDSRPANDNPAPPSAKQSEKPRRVATSAPLPERESPSEPPSIHLPVVTVRYLDLDALDQAIEGDLQHGGVFIPAEKPWPIGARLLVVIELGGDGTTTRRTLAEGEAEVVRKFDTAGDYGPNLLAGNGARFLEPEALRERLMAHSRRLRQSP